MINPNDKHKYKYTECFNNLEIDNGLIEKVLTTLKNKDLSWPFGVTQQFENEIAKFFDVKYALAHNNGTSAMYSAMYSVGVGKDTEVICPTYTFWASIAPAVNLGAKVVFCDINHDDLLIDTSKIAKFITNKTKAIIVPHLWGRMADVEKIKEICGSYNHKIFVIEDASHCFGATYQRKYLGSLSDIGIFSMQAGKILVAGEGGVMVTNDFNLYDSAIYLGHYERIRFLENSKYAEYSNTGGGYKFRIHPLAAAIAQSQLGKFKEKVERQNMLMACFEDKLGLIPGVKVMKKGYPDFSYGGRFGLRITTPLIGAQKLKFIEECQNSGLKVDNEYLSLLHTEKFFIENEARNIGKGMFPETEEVYEHLISLPVFYTGKDKEIGSFTKTLSNILAQ